MMWESVVGEGGLLEKLNSANELSINKFRRF